MLRKLISGWQENLKSPYRLALVAILLASFLLMNYTNLRGGNWSIHPDDHEAYLIGRNLKETGSLTVSVPLNEILEEPLFTPAGTTFSRGKIVPTRAYGLFFVCAIGMFLGDQGPFYLIPLFGLVLLIFLYKLVALVMDEKKALIATALFALSAPFLYWNNMLFSNAPGCALLVVGLYFLAKIAYGGDGRFRWYLLCAVFFSLTIWMRYEYALIIIWLFPIILLNRRSFKLWKTVAAIIILILVLSPILILNTMIYEKPFVLGYVESMYSAKTGSAEGETAEEAGGGIRDIYLRAGQNLLRPYFSKMYEKAYTCIFEPFPMLVLAGIIGILLMFIAGGRQRSFAVAMLLVMAFWGYYICTGVYFYPDSYIASSYARYLLIIYVLLAIGAPVLIERVGDAIGRNAYRALITLFIIAFLAMQITTLTIGSYSLKACADQKAGFRRVNDIANGLPENAVIVAPFYSKVIVGKNVITSNPTEAKDQTERIGKLIGYIRELLEGGYDVYIMEASWYQPMYMDLPTHISSGKDDIGVQEIAVYKTANGIDRLFKVYLEEGFHEK
ncbi:MAG: glycosyltransferase family 39 protein [Actinomycetia bacterium]|nr:glycosyltransferase family 39 protein [Actinomycetes bacterium]